MTEWIADFLERNCAAASLDNEHDRETVAKAIAAELKLRCPLCHEDLRGKTNRTHFVDGSTRPCVGSWL